MDDPQVWIVDDVSAVRDSLKALLQTYGMAVRTYASARDFLADFDAGRRGCLVLDLHMPQTSGLDLLAILRARGASLPVIAMTGRPSDGLTRRVLDASVMAVLHKPVDHNDLVTLIGLAMGVGLAKGLLPETDAAS